ncbi:hypothetical protein BDN72DRAFT_729363, partial [Pluteus cervinus]
EFGLKSRILSVTMDNASPNDTMVVRLERTLFPFFKALNRVRCFLHIVNLVAKSFLHQFDLKKKEKTDEWEFDAEDKEFNEVLKDYDDARKMFEEGKDSADDEDEDD